MSRHDLECRRAPGAAPRRRHHHRGFSSLKGGRDGFPESARRPFASKAPADGACQAHAPCGDHAKCPGIWRFFALKSRLGGLDNAGRRAIIDISNVDISTIFRGGRAAWRRTFISCCIAPFTPSATPCGPICARLGLGAGQPKLVAYLAEHGPCRQRELAAYFALDPAAVSRMVASLERGGFVTLSADPANRRCSLVRATGAGAGGGPGLAGRAAPRRTARPCEDFTPQERASLLRLSGPGCAATMDRSRGRTEG